MYYIMKQFKTDAYDNVPPFACCLYHQQILPKDQSFLQMIRFTFFPFFQLYSFTFFWIVTVMFVYIYSIYRQQVRGTKSADIQMEFLNISQSILFELGENYPYFIVKKYHYYRLIVSTLLFRNLYHFLTVVIGIIMFGSYIQQFVGFKRIFLLVVFSGVGGQLIRNAFYQSASIQSTTPIFGLIGYILGFFLANRNTNWKYCSREKIHMWLVIIMTTLPYIHIGSIYRNISLLSMAAAFFIGFLFYFCDPEEKYANYRMPSIVLLVAAIGISAFYLFFRVNPQLLSI